MLDPIDRVFVRRRVFAVVVVSVCVGVIIGLRTLIGGGVDDGSVLDATASSVRDASTTTEPGPTYRFPALEPGDHPGVVTTPDGIVSPIVRIEGNQTIGSSPCGVDAVVVGSRTSGAHVVLDPGHGGRETGAIGPNGVSEEEANLGVALATKERLEALGATVVLTRSTDVRMTVATRAAIVRALQPQVFISIHHNTVAKSAGPGIGSELYHQGADPDSKRLAGLLWEAYVEGIQPELSEWAHGGEPGVRARLSSDGSDFYGVLRQSAGVPGVLSEAAFLSDENEAALLATDRFHQVEAAAIVDAIVRFVSTPDPGSGFVPDTVSDESAGGGGTDSGCEDPPLR